jgi:hypothetical protein
MSAWPSISRVPSLQVEAGAEGPTPAREDHDAHSGVAAQRLEGLGNLTAQLAGERVHGRGTVQGEGGDAIRVVDEKDGLGHGDLLGPAYRTVAHDAPTGVASAAPARREMPRENILRVLVSAVCSWFGRVPPSPDRPSTLTRR